jgi:MFS family permease
MSDRWAVLKIRDFRLALMARFFDSLAIQMMAVAVGWQVYELTWDPLPLGFIGLAEAIPYMGVALWAGHLVDKREKRQMIVSAEAGILISALGLLSLVFMEKPPLTLIYFFLGVGGLCRSFQWAAIMTYMQWVVPKAIFSKAAAWSSSAWHAAAIVGPALGGTIYGLFGARAAYGAVVCSFAIALIWASRLKKIPPSMTERDLSGLADFLSGVRFVFSQQVILAAMSLDMFGVLFGGVVGVLPIFAVLLGVGPAGLGLLRAAPALGALASSLYLTHHRPFRRTGLAFVICMAIFGFCMIVFALSTNFVFSLLILAASGMVDCVGMVIRASIYQALTPDHLRGRVSSVNGIFIRSSNELGTFESGLAAKLMGTIPSVIFGGCMTLVSVVVAVWKAPQLRRFRLEETAP